MTESLLEYIERHRFDADTIQQATRYYLAEITDDRLPEELVAEIGKRTGEPHAVAAALKFLESDWRAIEACCMAFLTQAWQDAKERDRIKSAMTEAKNALPVPEVSIIAAVAVYALWLHYNKPPPPAEKREKYESRPDGTERRETFTKYQPPPGPLAHLAKLFTPRDQGSR